MEPMVLFVLELAFVGIIFIIGILGALLFKNGAYSGVLILALFIRIPLIAIREVSPFLGKEDIIDYLPHFQQFTVALSQGTLKQFVGIHVDTYTLLYPGWIIASFGADALWVVRICNAVVSLAVVVPVCIIAREVFDIVPRPWQIGIIVLWPTYVLYSTSVGRTAISVVLVLSTISIVILLFRQRAFGVIISAFLVIPLSVLIRVHYLFYPVFFVGGFILYGLYDKKVNSGLKAGVISAIVLTGIFIVAIYEALSPYRMDITLNTLISLAKSNARGGSSYLVNIYPQGLIDWIWYLPLQAFYFLFSPMPWDVLSIPNSFAPISSLLAWSVLLASIETIRRCYSIIWKNQFLFALVTAIALTAIGYGSVTKNAGAAVRWRLPTTLLLLTIDTNLLMTEYRTRTSFKVHDKS